MLLLDIVYCSRRLFADRSKWLNNLVLWFAGLGYLWQYDSIEFLAAGGLVFLITAWAATESQNARQVMLWNLDPVLATSPDHPALPHPSFALKPFGLCPGHTGPKDEVGPIWPGLQAVHQWTVCKLGRSRWRLTVLSHCAVPLSVFTCCTILGQGIGLLQL